MTLEALAFALLIGAQFLGAIVLISKRTTLYPDARRPKTERASERTAQRPPQDGWLAAAE